MATHDACLSLPDLANQDQPETARHPEGRSDEAPALLNTTPERDEASQRRRATPETADCLAAGDTGAGSDAASNASTSGRSSAASSSADLAAQDPQPLTQAVEDMLRAHLVSWGQRLVQLQPKVLMSEHLVECGLFLFKYLRQLQVEACYEGSFPLQYLSNEQLLVHDLVSCWWISLKHCSVRTAVPNRTLMCRATGASAELLCDRELAALIAIDWEVQAVLKQGGLVQ